MIEFSDVFAAYSNQWEKTNLVKHEIDVRGPKPIKCKPYQVPQEKGNYRYTDTGNVRKLYYRTKLKSLGVSGGSGRKEMKVQHSA